VRRLRQEEGFGLLELVMAMVMLNLGILAIVGAFNSGALALGRASNTSTASTLADQQLELFRGMRYVNIVQTTSEWNSAVSDSTYTADSVYTSSSAMNNGSPTGSRSLVPTVSTCPVTATNACDPSFTTTGPDGRSYRVDTYMYRDQPHDSSGNAMGGQIVVVTVVVRSSNDLAHSLARASSTYDQATAP
jgi:Tfp pilus assembly protein PilV